MKKTFYIANTILAPLGAVDERDHWKVITRMARVLERHVPAELLSTIYEEMVNVSAYFVKQNDVRLEQVCRSCGCSWSDGCDGGCEWVEPNLCCECVPTDVASTPT